MGVVHQRFGRHDNGHRLPLAGVGRPVPHSGSKAPRVRVDGGLALLALGLDVPAQRRLLRPPAVVGEVVLALFANARQGCTGGSTSSSKASGGLLAHRVEQLLRARGAAHDTLHARVDGVVLAGGGAVARLGHLAVVFLAIAQVVVVGLLIVAALAPHPGSEAGGGDGDGEDQGHPVAEGAAAVGRVLATVVAVVGEGHGAGTRGSLHGHATAGASVCGVGVGSGCSGRAGSGRCCCLAEARLGALEL